MSSRARWPSSARTTAKPAWVRTVSSTWPRTGSSSTTRTVPLRAEAATLIPAHRSRSALGPGLAPEIGQHPAELLSAGSVRGVEADAVHEIAYPRTHARGDLFGWRYYGKG